MEATNTEKKATSGSNEAPPPEEQLPLLKRRTVLLSALVAALVIGIGVPVYFFAIEDYCNTGDPLIDQACMKEKQRLEEIRLGKGKKFNIRPKKEPFKVVEGRISGGLNQLSSEESK